MKTSDILFRKWFLKTGIELCSDGLFIEGGRLIWYCESYKNQIDLKTFKKILKTTLHWEMELIENSILEIKGLTAFI